MKTFYHVSTLVSLVLVGLITCKSNNNIESGFENERIHKLLVETISSENIPGMIAAIVDSNGIICIESAGVRKIDNNKQITIDDHFHLGSCTKAMTSALLATLVANDEIKWETTIIDVFPEFRNIIHQDYHNVTIHQLVTHRAGIKANATNWWNYTDLKIKERRLAIIKENLKEPSQIKSGEFYYSNLGYMIAGSMMEKITGLSWETLIKNRLFEPLGMSSTGFGAPGTMDEIDQPWGHHKFNGKWQPTQFDNAEALGPAGRVNCSINDWVKFISLFLSRYNTKILERNQLDKLIEPIGDYACGWVVVQREWANGIAITHSGSNTMWFITVWIAPKINRAFIAGTNSCDENSGVICDKIIGNLIRINQDN